jgi:hypothetical protein
VVFELIPSRAAFPWSLESFWIRVQNPLEQKALVEVEVDLVLILNAKQRHFNERSTAAKKGLDVFATTIREQYTTELAVPSHSPVTVTLG